ncbi:hypothetical protein RvY_18572 [Ramazzottius varieornatus]|uniref:Uncharacterized protein n=1 Tax=Ramazzottius varieornatus TaxID=947166 RepID=A0A1D1W6K8_RAMVA|nr:hypothetical protein RvY_18572 [Ramazzottius varieornatus]
MGQRCGSGIQLCNVSSPGRFGTDKHPITTPAIASLKAGCATYSTSSRNLGPLHRTKICECTKTVISLWICAKKYEAIVDSSWLSQILFA